MGIFYSCPLALWCDLDNSFESVIAKSISFGNNDDLKMPVQSDLKIFRLENCAKMKRKDRVSSNTTENDTKVSTEAPSDKEINFEMVGAKKLPVLNPCNPKDEAAVKLQKVYKSFRTRRKLADCAVLIEQSWWKLLDFAELKHNSISFFENEKHETALSRWSRARTKAAKVGKGLSKNCRAQKLALQHWLEAIDPRHRYGHNLHFYYNKWLHSQSKEPFFYWLDIGEGKEVNLVDKCPRSKLQQQCIKYLGPMERKAYEVIVEDGKFFYKQTGELLDTMEEPKGAKWIFVLSATMNLYVGKKKKGTFQHSSFLAGGATSAAGQIAVENGVLKAAWRHSGHYQPTPENFQEFISFLRDNSVDLADVKMDPDEEEKELSSQSCKVYLRSMSSVEDISEKDRLENVETDSQEEHSDTTNSTEEEEKANSSFELPQETSPFHSFRGKFTNLLISNNDLLEEIKSKKEANLSSFGTTQDHTVIEQDSTDEENEENRGEVIPKEAILKRINSHKDMNSYQLGKHLSCKWTTGAGPRIGCVRDYPPKLQYHCLEKTNLSPKTCIDGNFRNSMR